MIFRIKEARTAANLTQKQLADMLGIKDTTLSGYETGAHDPKSNTLTDIARICNTTVDYLLGIDREALAENAQKEEPVTVDGLGEDERRFIEVWRDLNPANQRLLLEIGAVILRSQETPAD